MEEQTPIRAASRRIRQTATAAIAVALVATGVRSGSITASFADAPECPVVDPAAGQVQVAPAANGDPTIAAPGEGSQGGAPACTQGPAGTATTAGVPPGPPAPPPVDDPPNQPPERVDPPGVQHPESAPQPAGPLPQRAAPVAPAPEQAPVAAPPSPAPVAQRRARTHTVRAVRPARRRDHREQQVFFPPVSVDWNAISPLAPPQFGADEAARYPGPSFLLPIYEAASAQYDVPWQILAAINEVETDFGRNTATSSAGAVGWMQFLPSTWARWGVDADGDGVRNPNDPVDAIFAAARYLEASGSAHDIGGAVYAYNHAGWYVDRIIRRALELAQIPTDLLTSLSLLGRREAGAIRRATGSSGYLANSARARTIGQVMLLGDAALRRHVLGNAGARIYDCGRADVAAGIVDRRVLETIEFLAARRLNPTITSLRCGHGLHTASGNVSEHASGGALDIAQINGTPILGHQGPGSITEEAITMLLRLQGGLRPHQIISLMTFDGAPNTLALGDHDDHIHIGFAPVRPIEGLR